jgi:hypothetical protein
MFIGRNEILAIDDRRRERLVIPEWGTVEDPAEVWIQMMSGNDREIYESWAMAYNSERAISGEIQASHLYAKMAVLSCVDHEGNRIFSVSDVDALGRKSYAELKRIFDTAWRLNLFDPDEVEKAAKNSESEADFDSGSASLLSSEGGQ